MAKFDKKNIEDILSLTPMQEGMLFHYLKDPESHHYFEQLSLGISGEINVELFEKAWNYVIQTNEMLRAAFRWEKIDNPIRIILKKHQLQPKYYDFSGKKSSEKKTRVESIKDEDRKEKFDLREIPFSVTLCRIEAEKYEMIISNHHILYDGWSNGIILKEFFTIYNDLVHKRTPQKPIKSKFKEFVKFLNHKAQKAEEKFWKDYLKGVEEPSELPVKIKRTTGVEINNLGTLKISIKKDTREQIELFLHRQKITMATLLYCAWGILLQRYNNTNSVIFGTTVSGRSAKIEGIENIVGLFINTLPLRVEADSREKTIDMLNGINETLQMRAAYENTPLVKIRQYSACKLSPHENLFDSIVVIENYPLDKHLQEQEKTGELSINSYSIFEITNYDLTVSITLSEEIAVNLVYNERLFEKDVIRGLSRHFIKTLETIITNPENETREVEILSLEEKREILANFNDTESEYPQTRTLHELFAEQANRRPDNIALVGQVAWRRAQSAEHKEERHAPCAVHCAITYRVLNERSDQLAYQLKKKGVKPGTIAGITAGHSFEMLVGVLGILKAGGAYLPVDKEFPKERIEYILNNCNTIVLLTQYSLNNNFSFKGEIIDLDNEGLYTTYIGERINPGNVNRPGDAAYVLYTSGSTGKPKGVIVKHCSVVNYIIWAKKAYLQGERYDFPLYSSLSFDLTVTSIYLPLISGNKIFIYKKDDSEPIIPRIIKEDRVQVIKLTPTHLKMIKEIDSSSSNVKKLIVGGEELTTALAEEIYRKFNGRIEIYNEYGPTETVVGCTIYTFKPEEDKGNTVPIGTPVDNT